MGSNVNPMAKYLMDAVENCNKFLESAKTGQGLNLTPEQKVEFDKTMKEKGFDQMADNAKKEIQKMKDTIKNMK